jgi:hypothetical protein
MRILPQRAFLMLSKKWRSFASLDSAKMPKGIFGYIALCLPKLCSQEFVRLSGIMQSKVCEGIEK